MGCGASSTKGRESNQQQSNNFFPPPGSTSFSAQSPSKTLNNTTTASNNGVGSDSIVKEIVPNTAFPEQQQQQQQQQQSPGSSKKNTSSSSHKQQEQHQIVVAPSSREFTSPTKLLPNNNTTPLASTTGPKKKKAEYIPPSPIISEEFPVPPSPGTGTGTLSASTTRNKRPSSTGAGTGPNPPVSVPIPTTAATATSGAGGQNSIGSGDDNEGTDKVGQLKNGNSPFYPPAAAGNTTGTGADEYEDEEYHGELHLYNNDLDNAISVLTTDPDLHSEIPVQQSPKKVSGVTGGKSKYSATTNNLQKETMSEIIAKSAYQYPDDSPEPSSASGMRFDELYRLKGVLGTGAFSTVREGFHKSNADVSYAVKCINRKKLSEEDEAALLDEVSILKELKHPHIIRLFDFFTEPSTYYLIMERMRGGELFDRIVAKAYYNEKEARDTCRLILQAVEYCHDHHVAHRDLKPENLLLLSDIDDSAVKIADFGFAKKVYEPNSLTTQCGTPGYVAPEILEGTAYDERADMWSVGVILYILLGGYPPFIESTQRDLFRKIRKGEYEFHEEYWGTVSQDAKTLISSLLTVSASDRLTAVGALQNAWICGDDNRLASRDLGANLDKLRNFNAKRKFRAAVSTVIAVNKLNFGFNLVGKEFFSGNNKDDEQVDEEQI